MKSIWSKVGHKLLCWSLVRLISFDINQNLLARALKNIFLPRCNCFFHWHISFYIEKSRYFLLSSKQLYMSLLFLSRVPFSTLIYWLIFGGEQIWLVCILFLSLFHFLVPVIDCTFLQEYWGVNSWKYSRSNMTKKVFFAMLQTFRLQH